MAAHKFALGQTVRLLPMWGQVGMVGRDETFKILRLLPEAGGTYQYRLKSDQGGHERATRTKSGSRRSSGRSRRLSQPAEAKLATKSLDAKATEGDRDFHYHCDATVVLGYRL